MLTNYILSTFFSETETVKIAVWLECSCWKRSLYVPKYSEEGPDHLPKIVRINLWNWETLPFDHLWWITPSYSGIKTSKRRIRNEILIFTLSNLSYNGGLRQLNINKLLSLLGAWFILDLYFRLLLNLYPELFWRKVSCD